MIATKRMRQLGRSEYLVVRRALDNVWYGQAAPLEQAFDYVRHERNELISESQATAALIEYITMLIDALPDGETLLALSSFDSRGEQYRRLCEQSLAASSDYIERLKPSVVAVRRQSAELRREHDLAQNEVTRLRRRNKALQSEMKTLESRNSDLEQQITAANKKMLALTRHLDSLLGQQQKASA